MYKYVHTYITGNMNGLSKGFHEEAAFRKLGFILKLSF